MDAPDGDITARVQADLELPSYQYFMWKEKLLDLGRALREASPEQATKAIGALTEAQLQELAKHLEPLPISLFPGLEWLNEGLSTAERASLFEGLAKLDVVQLERVYLAVSEESYDAAVALSQAVADHARPATKLQFLEVLTAQIGLGIETLKDRRFRLVRSSMTDDPTDTGVIRATRGAMGAAAILGSLRAAPTQFDQAADYLRRGDLNLRRDLLPAVMSGARDLRIAGVLKCKGTCPPPVMTMHPETLAAILDGALLSTTEDVKCEIATNASAILTDLEGKVRVGDARRQDFAEIQAKAGLLQQQLDAAGIACPFKPIVIEL